MEWRQNFAINLMSRLPNFFPSTFRFERFDDFLTILFIYFYFLLYISFTCFLSLQVHRSVSISLALNLFDFLE